MEILILLAIIDVILIILCKIIDAVKSKHKAKEGKQEVYQSKPVEVDLFSKYRTAFNYFLRQYADLTSAYISTSAMNLFLSQNSSVRDQTEAALQCAKNRQDKELCYTVNDRYDDLPELRYAINNHFIISEKDACRALFNIDGKRLDDEQQTVVVTDEDHNLALAGAGSGKTLTITAKVNYLCRRKNIRPDDILLIAFARKAAEEMTERVNKMGIQAKAVTFHKLGLDIISTVSGKRPDVIEDYEFNQFLEDYLTDKIQDDPISLKALIEYLSLYLHIPADMSKCETAGAAYEQERNSDFETLKGKYSEFEAAQLIDEQEKELRTQKISLQGEHVKSLEEVTIANFLFLNGIRYDYERPYPIDTADSWHRQYKPDFYLVDYDIYLEHFGINEHGRLPQYSAMEEEKYIEGMRWKRETHRKNHTKLIETYSWYSSKGILIPKLRELMLSNGVRMHEADYIGLFEKVYQETGNKYFHEFISLCSTFVSLYKSNGYSVEDLDRLTYKSKDLNNPYYSERMRLFKTIIKPILFRYQRMLQIKGKVDFSDMIIQATRCVDNGQYKPHYKYIIIDEYQDISVARYKLVKSILDKTGAHLLCVGDDWQSIYRFSGSDIQLFTDFEKAFGASVTMRIQQTYRNSQQLIHTASKFIMKNPMQLKKTLRSSKSYDRPISIFQYEENPNKAIKLAVDRLIKRFGTDKSILFLGRTNADEEILLASTLFTVKRENGTRYIYNDCPEVDIRFMTVHRAKGLEADNVIILNFNNSLLGFPNKIADDPMLELVLSASDTFLYGEERRLFYVALTRTRNVVVLISSVNNPSEFIHDLEKDPNVFIKCIGAANNIKPVQCPRCSTGKLLIRVNEKTQNSFLGCTNYPRCTYTLNDVSVLRNPIRCSCGGFMTLRGEGSNRFYGCSNYPRCRRTREYKS